MDGDIPGGTDLLGQVRALYARGLSRQAWDQACLLWGEPGNWTGADQLIIAARMAYQLGMVRSARYFVLRAWRRHPKHAAVRYFYAREVLAQRGPVPALRLIRQWESPRGDTKLQSDWVILFAEANLALRDWDVAERYLVEAAEIDPDNRWLRVIRSEFYERQDRYQEALDAVLPVDPDGRVYRPAMQQAAHLMVLLGRGGDALTLLTSASELIESVPLLLHTFDLLLERGQHESAKACLQRAQALVPDGARYVTQRLAYATFEQHYHQGELELALTALQRVKGHFAEQVATSLRKYGLSAERKKLDVPFVRQHHMTCAPATFTALARYWGHEFEHMDVAERICYDGTAATTERSWIENLGWVVREFELNLEDLRALIDRGVPVGFATVAPGSAHMQAIIGYDLNRGVYLMRDPYVSQVCEILIDGAHESYASSGPRCIAYVPPDQASLLGGLTLRAAELYDHYYQLQRALEAHRRDAACNSLAALKEMAPEHRLCVWAERSLACYDENIVSMLASVETLRQRYPDDLNLMASYSGLLGELGRNDQKVAFLEQAIADGYDHPYLLQSLVDELRGDARKHERVEMLVNRILKSLPCDSRALYALAGLRWDAQTFEDAYEIYRWCACLEDKSETYAESFFKASRFFRQQDDALTFLRKRNDQLGHLSANPAVTLSRMLAQVSMDKEARQVLTRALATHPDNAWLICEAVDFFISIGDHSAAEAVLDAGGDCISRKRRMLLRATILQVQGKRAESLDVLIGVLESEPHAFDVVDRIARALLATKGGEQATEFISPYIEKYPHSYLLRGTLLELLTERPPDQRLPRLEELLAQFPDDGRVLYRAARAAQSLGQYDKALDYAHQLLAMDRNATDACMLLGDVLKARDDNAEAEQAYRSVIEKNVDADGVFYRLLSTVNDYEGKCRALTYIYEQLMSQVTFGNGLLEFVSIAPEFLPGEKLDELMSLAVEERPDLWQSWVAASKWWARCGRAEDAMAAIDAALTKFPLVPRLWMEQGELYQAAGDLPAAEGSYRHALDISPGWLRATTALADVLDAQGKHEDASALIERALERQPREGVLLGYLAEVRWRQERQTEAIELIKQSLTEYPGYGWAWDQFQYWSERTGGEGDALMFAQQLAQARGVMPELWSRCAELSRRPDEKIDFIRRARALRPRSTGLVIDECNALLEAGRDEDAGALLGSDVWGEIRPPEISAYEAWMIWRNGDRQGAVERMEAIVSADPSYADGWRYLAYWYRSLGQHAAGQKAAQTWAEKSPGSWYVHERVADYLLDAQPEGEQGGELGQLVKHHLQRAFVLQPASERLLVKLLDQQLALNLYEEVGRQLGMAEGWNSPYVEARRVEWLLETGELGRARQAYQRVLTSPATNGWLVLNGASNARKHRCTAAFLADVTQSISDGSAAPVAGRAWAAMTLDQGGQFKALRKALKMFGSHDKYLSHAIDYALRTNSLSLRDKEKLFSRYSEECREIDFLRDAAVELMGGQRAWQRVIRFMDPLLDKPGNSLNVMYFHNFALRQQGQWDRAQAVMARLMEGDLSDAFSSVYVWAAFDRFSSSGEVYSQWLGQITTSELAPIEHWCYYMLDSVAEVGVSDAKLGLARYRALLREARKQFPGMYDGGKLSNRIRRVVRTACWRRLDVRGWRGVLAYVQLRYCI